MAHDEASKIHNNEQTPSGAKIILLVEDDINIGEVLQQAITQETSFLVSLAPDGFQALQIIKGIKPNLFILDYQLPGMNGIELYDQLHSIPDLEHVPVLMMSAHLPRHELNKRKIQGMNKPIDLDEFLQAIENLVS
ncbi:response regulator [Dictyobacter alpinus]|uniref:Response regulator n=1 Tax=Dictyobacter alpinus TaxID=2014873 RepID=A0A402B459_9CHLR|nr:response regulator [Dictyobacter alpinus]GCE26097.1 response regulator [Dictyobacter alpinus]